MELILLAAIAYAAARGVESIVGDTKKRYGSKIADAAVRKAAKNKKEDKDAADPTKPGGTFSAREAAPRTASLGTKTAAVIATGVQAGATSWKSYREGYREAWPTAREDARKRQVERAKQRQATRAAKHERRRAEREAAEAQRQADAAAKAAGAADAARVIAEDAAKEAVAVPEPVYPPLPPNPPIVPEPRVEQPPATPATTPVAEPVKPNLILLKPEAAPAPALTPTGDTVIPEVRTLDGLLNALAIVKGNCLMRAEEADAIAARDIELAGQLDTFEAGLADLEVDPQTLAEIASLREKIAAQSAAASTYGIAAQNAADLASATANAAHKSHGGIAEAVQSAPIEAAAQAGYYNR